MWLAGIVVGYAFVGGYVAGVAQSILSQVMSSVSSLGSSSKAAYVLPYERETQQQGLEDLL
jgi:hypothetical protein